MTRRYAAVNDAGRVIGSEHHSAKLTDDDVELILALRDEGLSFREIADKFDDTVKVTKQMVLLICHGKRRQQTVMGHRRPRERRSNEPAHRDEFDFVDGNSTR